MGDSEFDPSSPPPFRLAEIRSAIPDHCWVKDTWRSLGYVVRDIFAILLLIVAAVYFDSWTFWPWYWAAQGTMFWALFVLGHDWRISHKTHHQNHGNVEKDESWVPLSENVYKKMGFSGKFFRFRAPFPLFAYPIYLLWRSPGKSGSHFNPYSSLFHHSERNQVVVSTLSWTLMVTFLFKLSTIIGFVQLVKFYIIPYLIFVMWLDFVTYLHHHGHHNKLPWYRGKEWSYLRGGLTTVDRDYGLINRVHHDIGTHVIHHLFPQIPHYHLVEATKAAKLVLGKYYREPKRSGAFPMHLVDSLLSSLKKDHFVSDEGEVVYYKTDPLIYGAKPNKGSR